MRTSKRGGALLMAAALTATVLPGSVAVAQAERQPISQAQVCPAPGGDRTFPDIAGTAHRTSIECAAGYDLVRGYADGRFQPSREITRAQMATFTRNLIEVARGERMPDGTATFSDTEGNTHEAAIRALATAGVVQGRGDGSFAPNDAVRRDQLATFVANAIDWIDDREVNGSLPPAAGSAGFTDVPAGNTHRGAIDRLAAVDVVSGVGQDRYDPSRTVPRGQMARFVMNAAAYLDTADRWAPTAGDDSSRPHRGEPITSRAPQVRSASVIGSNDFQQRAILEVVFTEPLAQAIAAPANVALVEPQTQKRLVGGMAGVSVVRGDDPTRLRIALDFNAIGGYRLTDLDRFSVLAVDQGAVTRSGADAVENAPGSVPLTPTSYAAGRTDAPDLLRVQDFRAGDDGDLLVDFVFDAAVYPIPNDTSLYELVLTDGSRLVSTAAVSGGEQARQVVTATFEGSPVLPLPGSPSPSLDPAEVRDHTRRAGIRYAAGTTAGTVLAPQAIDVAEQGRTAAPDLISVTLDPSRNRVVYRFDEDVALVSPTDSPSRFRLVGLDGTVSAAASELTVDGEEVTARFPAGTVDTTVVRATVDRDAVRAAGTDTPLSPQPRNSADDADLARTVPAGRTFAPNLDRVTTAPGVGGETLVTYVFDRVVSSVASSSHFTLVDTQGTATAASMCARGSDQTTVTCEFVPTTTTPIAAAGFRSGAVSGSTFGAGTPQAHADSVPVR